MGKFKTQEEMFLNKKQNEIHVDNKQEQVAQERMIELQDMSRMEQNSQNISRRAFVGSVGGNAELSVPREASRKGSKKRQHVLEEKMQHTEALHEDTVQEGQMQHEQKQDNHQAAQSISDEKEKRVASYDEKLNECMSQAMDQTNVTGILTDEQIEIYQNASSIQTSLSEVNKALVVKCPEIEIPKFVEKLEAIVDTIDGIQRRKRLCDADKKMFYTYRKEACLLYGELENKKSYVEQVRGMVNNEIKQLKNYEKASFISQEYRDINKLRIFNWKTALLDVEGDSKDYEQLKKQVDNQVTTRMRAYIQSLKAKGDNASDNEKQELRFFIEKYRGYFSFDSQEEKYIEEKKAIVTSSNTVRKEHACDKVKEFEKQKSIFPDSKALDMTLTYLQCAQNANFYNENEAKVEAEAFSNAKKQIEQELSGQQDLLSERAQMLQACSAYLEEISRGTLQPDARVKNWDGTNMKYIFQISSGKDSTGKEKYKDVSMKDRKDEPLFVHEPCISDIKQGKLGDCYFLASLASVVEKDPGYVKRHMRDDSATGTVTVRFYYDGKPMDITVPKKTAVYYDSDSKAKDAYANGALWVQLYEIAYAAFKLIGSSYISMGNPDDLTPKKQRKLDQSRAFFFKKEIDVQYISGGNEEDALRDITGQKVESRYIGEKTVEEDKTKLVYSAVKQFRTRNGKGDPYAVMHRYFGGRDGTQATREQKRIQGFYVTYLRELRNHLKRAKSLEEFDTMVENMDVVNGMQTHQVPGYDMEDSEAIKGVIISRFLEFCRGLFMRDNHIANEAYSGEYDVYADDIYNEIAEHETKNQTMTAGTRKLKDGEIGLNGENVIDGIAGGHAYTLLGVKQIGKYKYVKIRNPWGNSSRVVGKVDGVDAMMTKVRDDRDGVFLLELNDYVKYFGVISVVTGQDGNVGNP